jgi:hypothetical protein
MLLIILVIVTALVCWSLRLMQQALDRKEFSLMLAGTLVASSAAAMMVVYFLMGNCMDYLAAASHSNTVAQSRVESFIDEISLRQAFPPHSSEGTPSVPAELDLRGS